MDEAQAASVRVDTALRAVRDAIDSIHVEASRKVATEVWSMTAAAIEAQGFGWKNSYGAARTRAESKGCTDEPLSNCLAHFREKEDRP